MSRSVLPADSYDVAHVGFLIGDASRAAMLLALMNDVARPASELARIAGVTAPTASAHLGRLVAGGLVGVARQGRHRYYRLAHAAVAQALEAVALVRPLGPARRQRLQREREHDPERHALAEARLCYQHLAGRLGVLLADALLGQRWVRRAGTRLFVTRAGAQRLDALGLDGARLEGKSCLDWTERRAHVGGALGVAWTRLLLTRGWIKRAGDGRAVRLTDAGRRGLARELGVDV